MRSVKLVYLLTFGIWSQVRANDSDWEELQKEILLVKEIILQEAKEEDSCVQPLEQLWGEGQKHNNQQSNSFTMPESFHKVKDVSNNLKFPTWDEINSGDNLSSEEVRVQGCSQEVFISNLNESYKQRHHSNKGLNWLYDKNISFLYAGWVFLLDKADNFKIHLKKISMQKSTYNNKKYLDDIEKDILIGEYDLINRNKLEIHPETRANSCYIPSRLYDLSMFQNKYFVLNKEYDYFVGYVDDIYFSEIANNHHLILEGEGIGNLTKFDGIDYYPNEIIIRPGEIIKRDRQIILNVAFFKIIFEEDAMKKLADNKVSIGWEDQKQGKKHTRIKKLIVEDKDNINDKIHTVFRSCYSVDEVECKNYQNMHGIKAEYFSFLGKREDIIEAKEKINVMNNFVKFQDENFLLVLVFKFVGKNHHRKFSFSAGEEFNPKQEDIERIRMRGFKTHVTFRNYAFLILLGLKEGALDIKKLNIFLRSLKQQKRLINNFNMTGHFLELHSIKNLQLMNAERFLQVEGKSVSSSTHANSLDCFNAYDTFSSKEPNVVNIINPYLKFNVRKMMLNLSQFHYFFYLSTKCLENLLIFPNSSSFTPVSNYTPILADNKIKLTVGIEFKLAVNNEERKNLLWGPGSIFFLSTGFHQPEKIPYGDYTRDRVGQYWLVSRHNEYHLLSNGVLVSWKEFKTKWGI